MEFNSFFWPDSQLESIQIKFDFARLEIWNDLLQKKLVVSCTKLAGVTNLYIWDDTIISDAQVYPVREYDSLFLRTLAETYDINYNYGERSLKNGLLELRIQLVNNTSFSVYCQDLNITEE